MTRLVYHVTLWLGTLLTLLLLDFSKHIDDVLFGLTVGELALNILAVMPLAWIVALLFALISAKAEQAGYLRAVHFFVIFSFTTVNAWSIKTGLAPRLAEMIGPTRAAWGWAAFVAVLLFSAGLARAKPQRYDFVETYSGPFLKFSAAAFLVCLLGFLDLPTPFRLPPSDAPNVILVTFDTMTADHMSVYGYERQTTPNLQKWANESWVFEDVHSNYNSTPAALVSLNGNLPEPGNSRIVSRQRGLWEILRTNGYPQRGFFSFANPERFFGMRLPGDAVTRSGKKTWLWRSWHRILNERQLRWLANLLSEEPRFYWPYISDYDDDIFWRENHFPGDLSLAAALSFLTEHPRGAFVWIHLWEPHYPYWPDADLKNKFGPVIASPAEFINRPYTDGQRPWVDSLRNRYDQTVLTSDRLFGQFLESLRERGLYDDSWLIVAADHGESFSNGYVGHSGPSVLNSISHIPLIIHPPRNKEPKRIATRASQIDLAPTLLELLRIPAAPHLPGESLVAFIENPDRESNRARFTVSTVAMLGTMPGDIAIYYQNYKAVYLSIDRRNVRLYDLKTDPNTKVDIAKENPEIVEMVMKRGGVWD